MQLLESEKGQPRWQVRQHVIVLLTRKPRKLWVGVVALALLTAYLWPAWFALPAILVVGGLGFLRLRLWQAERVVLTSKRIVHVYGVLETTREEASLRLDRVSGLRIKETFWGRTFGYATIYVEAPGDHPGLKKLFRVARAEDFYLQLRNAVFGEPHRPDPNETSGSGDYITEELPPVTDRRRR